MPIYKVIAPGFHNDLFYHPEGKRNILETDKPFTKKNPMPSWLSEMPEESEALKAKREAYEKAQAELEAEKAKQDAEDIKAASTEGEGENSESFFLNGSGSSDKPETL